MIYAILNSKLSLAAEKEIRVKAEAKIPMSLSVSGLDLCIIIGNLLDNAMEACMELPVEKRLIRIYMEMKGNYLYLALTNTAAVPKKYSFRSRKGDGHGVGLSRVDSIVQKYGGYVTRASEDAAFSTTLAKEQAIREKRRAMILETQSCNVGAIAFYLQEGFELIGFDSCCYSNRDLERKEVRLDLGYFIK